ncbi:hypothetical protein X735_33275 [Mesorhizobium sp. L2C085B000]|nr:hypothetical protein X735_33275 [Mesorhizobium sp. L2C085B000]
MVTPDAKRCAVAHACDRHGVSQRRACKALFVDRSSVRYTSIRSDDAAVRAAMKTVAAERRRFGYRRIHIMLERQGIVMNQKKLRRLYREEKLQVRKRGGRKRALGTRRPMIAPGRTNERWSLDFVSDAFTDGRRFRVLAVVDDFTRECLALVADTSLSGARVARELDAILARRGRPRTIVSDNVLRAEGKWRRQSKSLCSSACSRRMTLVKFHSRTRRLPPAREKISSIANTGYADSGPHRPQHELLIQVEDPNIIYRVIAAMPLRPS